MYNKKISKILIGTNNEGKLREIKDLLPKSLKIYSTKDFKIKSPIEKGKSFLSSRQRGLKRHLSFLLSRSENRGSGK